MLQLLPAIDLLEGRCVRLRQGNYDDSTVFSEDPVDMALRWRDEGAERLHLVDLDGAKAGRAPVLPHRFLPEGFSPILHDYDEKNSKMYSLNT